MSLEGKKILPTKLLIEEPPKEKEEVRNSGIIVPKAVTKELSSTGIVRITGGGSEKIPNPVPVGAHVMYSPHAISRVFTEDGEFVLLDIRDTLLYW